MDGLEHSNPRTALNRSPPTEMPEDNPNHPISRQPTQLPMQMSSMVEGLNLNNQGDDGEQEVIEEADSELENGQPAAE